MRNWKEIEYLLEGNKRQKRAYDIEQFKTLVFKNFGMCNNYLFKTKVENAKQIVVINFQFMKFEFEIYSKSSLTKDFNSYKHILIEHRILVLLGNEFLEEIVRLKKCLYKQESIDNYGNVMGH